MTPKVAVSGFVIAGGKSPRVCELVEAAFDHVAQSIDGGIDRPLDQPVPLDRDDNDAAVLLDIFANEVSVITSFGEQHLGAGPSAIMIGG